MQFRGIRFAFWNWSNIPQVRGTFVLCFLLISVLCSLVSSLPHGQVPKMWEGRRVLRERGEKGFRKEPSALKHQCMLRLRGGVQNSDEESTESSQPAIKPTAAKSPRAAAATAAAKTKEQEAAAAAKKNEDAASMAVAKKMDEVNDTDAAKEPVATTKESPAAQAEEELAGQLRNLSLKERVEEGEMKHGAVSVESEGGKEEGQDGVNENAEATSNSTMERPKPTPEMVRQMNERMWEAAQEGNEPLLAKALAGGANVNAFCRGPDRWLNISIGEIAGADEEATGLNAHWMELNNYTALHLAAASGNPGIMDELLHAGADINAECLQRIHPFPTHRGGMLSWLTNCNPHIFKCTPLRIARAANCGRCFYTSYQRSVEKLLAANAIDNDLHYPINTVVVALIYCLFHLGMQDWPFPWFKEWPYNFDDFPDFHVYMYGKQQR